MSETSPPFKVEDIHAKDLVGRTALHYAAGWGRKDTVIALLDRGADINASSAEGWTPLHHAASYGHTETLITLLDRGANIDAQNNDGETPLLLSLFEEHQSVTVALLERGCDCKVKDVENCSALHVAAENGWTDVVRALLKKGVDIHERDNTGMMPIQTAAFFGRPDIVELLITPDFFQGQSNTTSADCNDSVSDTNTKSSSPSFSFHDLNSNVDLLSKLADQFPDDYMYPQLIAEALFEKKQYSEAGFYFDRAIQLDPKNATAFHTDEIDQTTFDCDGCEKEIIGIRYMCKECEDFDFCSSCYADSTILSRHAAQPHDFFRVPSENWRPPVPIHSTGEKIDSDVDG